MTFVQMSGVHKRFGGVRALNGARLEVERGEVHGLLGPNGSGKSTLNKILTGVVAADAGDVRVNGTDVRITGPRDSARLGIAAVYQQLTLVPHLTVEQNIVLGMEPTRAGLVSNRRTRGIAATVLERVSAGLEGRVGPGSKVSRLTPGEQQLVELAKALARHPAVLILDEATASLHRDQVRVVFDIVRQLTREGVSTLFVSHRLNEIYEICDRVTVLRSGETVDTVRPAATPERALVELMVGQSQERSTGRDAARTEESRRSTTSAVPALEVRGLAGGRLRGVDLQVRHGEVLGLGGLQGQGQSELLLTLFGARRSAAGSILVRGQEVRLRGPRDAARQGIALVPGDRDSQGTFSTRPIQENLSAVSLTERAVAGVGISASRERAAAQRMLDALSIKIGALRDPISTLSGGNQQKVVIAKWLLADPSVVLLDDPTKGIDVGAKSEIYALIRRLAADGVAVVLNSSEDRELAELADRVAVMFEGQVITTLDGPGLSVDQLVEASVRTSAQVAGKDMVR